MTSTASMPVIDSQQLDWIAPRKELAAEASTIGTGGCRRIAVRSARTGRILCYELSHTARDGENDVTLWKYRPMNFVGCHTMTRTAAEQYPVLVIFND